MLTRSSEIRGSRELHDNRNTANKDSPTEKIRPLKQQQQQKDIIRKVSTAKVVSHGCNFPCDNRAQRRQFIFL